MAKKYKFNFCGSTAELSLVEGIEGGISEINPLEDPKIIIKIDKNASTILLKQTILHELFEVAFILFQSHFICSSGNNYTEFFHFDHDKFTIFTDEISIVYEDLIKRLGLR